MNLLFGHNLVPTGQIPQHPLTLFQLPNLPLTLGDISTSPLGTGDSFFLFSGQGDDLPFPCGYSLPPATECSPMMGSLVLSPEASHL